VKAFAANTNVGTVRKTNEDRISIILNVIQPATKTPKLSAEQWPRLQIFGVFDGHGGSKCAEYLKDQLHNNIIIQPEFP
jgi:protein phosphatase PTC2/3